MPLKYALFDNPVTADPTDRMAVVQLDTTYSEDDVFARMVSRGSTVTRAEALSVLEEYALAVEQLLGEGGGSITTPLFLLTLSIVGVFTSEDDSFDPARHQVKIRITPGVRLRQIEPKIRTQKVTAEKPRPVLLHYIDNATESQDEVITPGAGASILGSLLKYDEADPEQGIFFVKSDGNATKVNGKPMRNKPGELIFIVPNGLSSGSYRVEVRTRLKNVKELRTGALAADLTVGEL